jgi:F-type H+-transporting ATPase subunit gamma
VVISTNKGLCGGFNTNLLRAITHWFTNDQMSQFVFVTMGKKAESFLVRHKNKLLADFSDSLPFSLHIGAVTKFIVDGYIKGEFKDVYLIYNNFISALKQDPIKKKILPISEFELSVTDQKKTQSLEFIVEPKVETIIDSLLINYLENQVRDAILESEASEHSARMIAMKNATDNAIELMDLLTLEYNKARQEKITYEIAEIVTARLAVE